MADDTLLLAALAVIQAAVRSASNPCPTPWRTPTGSCLIPDRFRSLVDLGSGGGLPALVIAWHRQIST
jgi:hypothetical protein